MCIIHVSGAGKSLHRHQNVEIEPSMKCRYLKQAVEYRQYIFDISCQVKKWLKVILHKGKQTFPERNKEIMLISPK